MWVKICGFRQIEEVQAVAELQPDAIGLNFYACSKRFVSIPVAAEICAQLPASIKKVGVFVDQTPTQIREIVSQTGLDIVQLHGDYSPAQAAELAEFPLIWAYRMGQQGVSDLEQQVQQLQQQSLNLIACLVDAHAEGVYGGSGKSVDWELLAQHYRHQDWPPLLLAGGLSPQNVQRAITTIQPWGVDVASGVELAGRKDPDLSRQFLEQARK